MARTFETQDGKDINAGLIIDGNTVTLGNELPYISVGQFVGFATLTLIEGIFPHLDPATRQAWHQDMSAEYEHIKALRTRILTGQYLTLGLDELWKLREEKLNQQVEDDWWAAINKSVQEVVYYEQNPFSAQRAGLGVNVHEGSGQVSYALDSEPFFDLTYHVVTGGRSRWQEGGVPSEVKAAAEQLNLALQRP